MTFKILKTHLKPRKIGAFFNAKPLIFIIQNDIINIPKKQKGRKRAKVYFMIKLKIFDKEIKTNQEYLFTSFKELYNDLLNTRYLSTDCDYLTGYILEKFNIKESAWNQFLDELNEKNLDTDYFSDFDKFLKSNNINYSINNLTDQDFYNIIIENLSINGGFKFYYCYIDNSNIEIDTYLIKFFDESGNNIINNLVFCETLLNEELKTLELRQKFLLLFNTTILEHPGVYIDDLFDKYCVIFEDKIYNVCNDNYMYINSINYEIYDYGYCENEKRYLIEYEINGIKREWVFYAKNKAEMCEMLFGYKIPEDCEDNYKIFNVIEM